MIVIAARDSSPADRAGADVVCDGRTDVAVLAKALAVPDREVVLTTGTFDANAGFTASGNRYLRPAEGVTVRGGYIGLARISPSEGVGTQGHRSVTDGRIFLRFLTRSF